MIKVYDYAHWCTNSSAQFEVDTEKFTPKMAQDNLDFFAWFYDRTADPVDEIMKKYAGEAILVATNGNWNTNGVIDEFSNKEGFYPLDGSHGIKLKRVEAIELDTDDFRVIKTNVKIKES